jgi:hypothetical protein
LFAAGDRDALRRVVERIAADPSWFAHLDVRPLGSIGECFDRYELAYRT